MATEDRFQIVDDFVKLQAGGKRATYDTSSGNVIVNVFGGMAGSGNAFGKISIPSIPPENKYHPLHTEQYRWDLSVKRLRYSHLVVGITSNRKLKEKFYENKNDPNYAYYPMDCKKFSKSVSLAYGRPSINWGESFTISIALNLKSKTIKFYKNGKDQGVAYKNIKTGKGIKYSLAVSVGDAFSVTITKYREGRFQDIQNDEQKQNTIITMKTESELQALKNEIVTLKNNVQHLQAANMEATKTISKLEFDKNKQQKEYMKQIEQLKSQSSKLLDEQKEMQFKIGELEKENKMLKHFEQWNHDDILNWMFSIQNGLFEQNYGDVLRKEIKKAELTGTDLIEMNTNDMKGFGINVFKHRKLLEKEIQKLVQTENMNNNIAVNDEGSDAPTAYV